MVDPQDDFDLGLDDDLANEDGDFDALDEDLEEDGLQDESTKVADVFDPNDPRIQRPDIQPR